MEENHTALHYTQSVVLPLSAAAEYHGKHQPFWNKFLSPLKPLAAHKFACLSVTPGYPGFSPSVGFLTPPSCPPGKCNIYFTPSIHSSETNLQVLKSQTGFSFNLIFTRLAAFSSNETLLPMPALGFVPS